MNDYYFYLYIYRITPNGVNQRLAKKIFSDADDRRHKKKKKLKFDQHQEKGIQKSRHSERVNM